MVAGGKAGRRRPVGRGVKDPRLVAYECLAEVDDKGGYANLAMPEVLARAGFGSRDAAFATELAYGTIRMRGLYDAVIAIAAKRPVDRIEEPLLRVLRLGVHQALGMRVPSHAAVDETVTLARTVVGERATGFANAVMRVIVGTDREVWLDKVAPQGTPGSLATRYSHPEWIVEELVAALAVDGREDEIESLLAANNEPALVTLVALPLVVPPEGRGISSATLAAQVGGGTRTTLSPFGVILSGGDPRDIPAVRDGRARVQDEGSQLAALALTAPDIVGPVLSYGGEPSPPGERWLDLCAGPGGKAALLGALAVGRGATLDAREIHPHRADLVRQSIRALPKGVVTVTVGDAREWDQTGYDRVLLDAPCTGLGALRRRPEARWRRSREDLANLIVLQRELLRAALGSVRPGGLVAYVTCSPVCAETRHVVEAVLAEPESPAAEIVDARSALADITHVANDQWGNGPFVQLWTHEHGTDSMFISLLRRRSSGIPER
jgi:16S rRNA (cytosine967-C5)-methyltransferase